MCRFLISVPDLLGEQMRAALGSALARLGTKGPQEGGQKGSVISAFSI